VKDYFYLRGGDAYRQVFKENSGFKVENILVNNLKERRIP